MDFVQNYIDSLEKQNLDRVDELRIENKKAPGVKQRELQMKSSVQAAIRFLKTAEKGLTIYTTDRIGTCEHLLEVLKADDELDYEQAVECYDENTMVRYVHVYYKEKKHVVLIKLLH